MDIKSLTLTHMRASYSNTLPAMYVFWRFLIWALIQGVIQGLSVGGIRTDLSGMKVLRILPMIALNTDTFSLTLSAWVHLSNFLCYWGKLDAFFRFKQVLGRS